MPDPPTAEPLTTGPQAKAAPPTAADLFGGAEPIETHAAWVFLAGDRAWKLKKPVNLGYLDFSTPEKRRLALEAELLLNRRTAPATYLNVHRVTRNDAGQVTLDGPGEAVDWVLEMRRFPDGALLDERASAGGIDMAMMLDLADAIAALHDVAPVTQGWDSAQHLTEVIDGNAQRLEELIAVLPAERSRTVVRLQREALATARALLARRAAAGRVRRVHGDLHLRNVAVVDGKPVPFDCLEFDEALATIDVLYDLAFLLMDLWHRGLTEEANAVFNRYLDVSAPDEDGAPLLPLFLSLRATIRAHVEATRADQGRAEAAPAARSYLELALAAMQPREARLVAVGGLSGTGKTTVARALGAAVGPIPGARLLRSDVLRKRDAGLRPEQRLPVSSYTPAAADHTYRLLMELAAKHIAAGETVIADAAFQERSRRQMIAEVARSAGVTFTGLWLVADRDVRIARVRSRQGDASDADETVARAQSGTEPNPEEPWEVISAGGALHASIAAACTSLGVTHESYCATVGSSQPPQPGT
jgi:aminoglycoside phosphotransferase family enzyme/predicted kinase